MDELATKSEKLPKNLTKKELLEKYHKLEEELSLQKVETDKFANKCLTYEQDIDKRNKEIDNYKANEQTYQSVYDRLKQDYNKYKLEHDDILNSQNKLLSVSKTQVEKLTNSLSVLKPKYKSAKIIIAVLGIVVMILVVTLCVVY